MSNSKIGQISKRASKIFQAPGNKKSWATCQKQAAKELGYTGSSKAKKKTTKK